MINKHSIAILVAVILGGLFLAAPVKAKIVDSIALVVDQDAMTQGELQEALESYFANQQSKMPKPGTAEYEDAKKQVVESFIREVLLAEEADREKLELQEGEVDHEVDNQIQSMRKNFPTEQDFNDSLKNEGISLDDLKQDIRDKMTRRIKATHLLRQKQQELPGSVVVTDTDTQKYYEQHPNDYERVKFSIILLRVSPQAKPSEIKQVEAQAQGILKQAKSGGDFAALAKKYSEDPGSAADGGDVGTVSRSEIGDPKLAAGVFALKAPGFGLVRATDGIYVVKVISRGKADYDTAAADIKALLKKQKQDNAINAWIDGLKKDAYIVEDGKVVSSETFMSTTSKSAGPVTVDDAPTTMTEEDEKALGAMNDYPSLPAGGSFLANFGGQGFLPDATDLSNFYSPTNSAQAFPFGLGAYGGVDYALDTTWQFGIKGEVLRKFSQAVTNSSGNIDQWNSTAVGASLDLKLLIPLDESTNFILSASGGVFTLLDSSVTIAGTGQYTNFSATNFGGQAGVGLEFLLDDQKSMALDLGIDYRLLSFDPVTSSNTGFFPSPLTNNNGGNGTVDFSGFNVDLGLKFLLGKDDSKKPKT